MNPSLAMSSSAQTPAPPPVLPAALMPASELAERIRHRLDEGKAEDITVIDLEGRSGFADYLVIANGRSDRQVIALADQLASMLKDLGFGSVSIEGKTHGDWVLIDAFDVIVHLFRPEVRLYYNLEKMWGAGREHAALS